MDTIEHIHYRLMLIIINVNFYIIFFIFFSVVLNKLEKLRNCNCKKWVEFSETCSGNANELNAVINTYND